MAGRNWEVCKRIQIRIECDAKNEYATYLAWIRVSLDIRANMSAVSTKSIACWSRNEEIICVEQKVMKQRNNWC
jgi:hypothetical protein